jgi:transcriptional regulator with XRE-family HTH domain
MHWLVLFARICYPSVNFKVEFMEKSHPVDVHVGARLRQRRTLLGMSQTTLGDAVDLTFQQVQKYERGSNRVSSSRLFEFAKVLDVPITYFFEEMSSSMRAAMGRGRKRAAAEAASLSQGQDPLIKRETLELVRAYYKIREAQTRKSVLNMISAVGAVSGKKR